VLEAVKQTKTVEKLVYTSSFFALGPTDGAIADENQVQYFHFCFFIFFVFLLIPNSKCRFIITSFSAQNMRNQRLLLIKLHCKLRLRGCQ